MSPLSPHCLHQSSPRWRHATRHLSCLLFGASLTVLNKKGGGVRPIAVECPSPVGSQSCQYSCREAFGFIAGPLQLGYGIHLGAEAAAHSARLYLADLPTDNVFLKLDFKMHLTVLGETKLLRQRGGLLLKSSLLYTPAMPAPPPSIFAVLSCIPLRVSSKATLLVLYSFASPSVL